MFNWIQRHINYFPIPFQCRRHSLSRYFQQEPGIPRSPHERGQLPRSPHERGQLPRSHLERRDCLPGRLAPLKLQIGPHGLNQRLAQQSCRRGRPEHSLLVQLRCPHGPHSQHKHFKPELSLRFPRNLPRHSPHLGPQNSQLSPHSHSKQQVFPIGLPRSLTRGLAGPQHRWTRVSLEQIIHGIWLIRKMVYFML